MGKLTLLKCFNLEMQNQCHYFKSNISSLILKISIVKIFLKYKGEISFIGTTQRNNNYVNK